MIYVVSALLPAEATLSVELSVTTLVTLELANELLLFVKADVSTTSVNAGAVLSETIGELIGDKIELALCGSVRGVVVLSSVANAIVLFVAVDAVAVDSCVCTTVSFVDRVAMSVNVGVVDTTFLVETIVLLQGTEINW